MQDILFIITHLAILPTIYYFLKYLGENLTKVSIVSFTTICLYLFSIVGTIPLYFKLDPYRVSLGITNKSLIFEVLIYSSINLIFMLIGVAFTFKILKQKSNYESFLPIKLPSKTQYFLLFLLFCLILVAFFNYSTKIANFALIIVLKFGPELANIARSNMGNSFSGKYHWYSLIMHDFGNLITFITFGTWLISRKKRHFMCFMISFCFSFFVSIMAIEKAPFAWLLIGLFFVYCATNFNFKIPLKKLVFLVIGVLFLLNLTYIFFMGSNSFSKAIASVFSRAFAGSISPAYFYLKFIPDEIPYLHGLTFPNPRQILPYTPVNYTIEIMNRIVPIDPINPVVATAPTVFWGEAYANFGVLGIPIVAFIIGCLLGIINKIISKLERNIIAVALNVWLIMYLKDLSVSGFSGYLLSIKGFCVSLVFLLLQTTFFTKNFIYRQRFIN